MTGQRLRSDNGGWGGDSSLTGDFGSRLEKTLVAEWCGGSWLHMQAPMAVSFKGMTGGREVNQTVLVVRGNDVEEVPIRNCTSFTGIKVFFFF